MSRGDAYYQFYKNAPIDDDINYLFDNDHDNDNEDGDDDSYKVVFADTMSVVIGEHTLATDGNFLSDNDDNYGKRASLRLRTFRIGKSSNNLSQLSKL